MKSKKIIKRDSLKGERLKREPKPQITRSIEKPDSRGFKKKLGAYGEKIAQRFLINHGYTIKDCNYINKVGEIDIVCEKDKRLSIVEVKTVIASSSKPYIRAEDHIDTKKINKVIKVGKVYALKSGYDAQNIAIDAILVKVFQKNGYKGEILRDDPHQLKLLGAFSRETEFRDSIQKVTVLHLKNINIY